MFEELRFNPSLGSDNHSGAHPRILEAVVEANRGHAHAYGLDELCSKTERLFKKTFGDDVEAQYVFTGTAANVLSLAPTLKSFQAVICSDLAHLNLDECGAPEKFWGAKLYTLPSREGKIHPEQAAVLFERMGDQHYAQPRAVSLTQPTELGTCYSLEELRAWKRFCLQKNLMLHIDGARLANAAVTLNSDLREITAGIGADAVSFGGTKNGLLGAEAVLFFSDEAKRNFKFYRKQAMQLSSKTRFLAAQFYAYLESGLWREIATHTTRTAKELEIQLRDFPEIRVIQNVESNALFVQLPRAWLQPLRERFFFYVWSPQESICRWMVSWDWNPDLTQNLLNAIAEVKKCHPITK